jgi:hypothetical protein
VRLACSWRLHAGRDAVISAAFHLIRHAIPNHAAAGRPAAAISS